MSKKKLAIVVGGGPAPGINGVISSVTIEALNSGLSLVGIRGGLAAFNEKEGEIFTELNLEDVSQIAGLGGSILGTSRDKVPDFGEIVDKLLAEQITYLVTIGGDGSLYCAKEIARIGKGKLLVGHVPKTIDNDLPLPDVRSCFGFQTAREVGAQIVDTLMMDARTTRRWYLVVAMGRKAGHLSLGVGISADATLTIIPEEVEEKSPLSSIVDTIAGAIVKRHLLSNKDYGVVVLAEGIADKIDPSTALELANCEKDAQGSIRFRELDFVGLVKRALRERLAEMELEIPVVGKNIGYELRCTAPNAFDREYTRELGWGVVNQLLQEKTSGMITRKDKGLELQEFSSLVDKKTGRTRIRYVDLNSVVYRVAREYMIRPESRDFKEEKGKVLRDFFLNHKLKAIL